MAKTYAEKLRDPRWQRRRLEILNQREWFCCECCATDKTLHVHHGTYIKGRDPWDYPDELLHVLCEDCHTTVGHLLNELGPLVGTLTRYQLEKVIGFVDAMNERETVNTSSPARVEGAAAHWGVCPSVVESVSHCGKATTDDLCGAAIEADLRESGVRSGV